jgi:hypothetical protein
MTAETTINVVKQNNEEYSIVGTLEHAESSFDSIFCCPIKELDEFLASVQKLRTYTVRRNCLCKHYSSLNFEIGAWSTYITAIQVRTGQRIHCIRANSFVAGPSDDLVLRSCFSNRLGDHVGTLRRVCTRRDCSHPCESRKTCQCLFVPGPFDRAPRCKQ